MFTTILGLLQIAMPVILWILDKFKVSKENREAFIKKVQSAKDDGRISIEARDEFKRLDQELKDEQAARDSQEKPPDQP